MEVFFSYAHEDEPLRELLETHLVSLRRQGLIRAWHDRLITAGAPIDNEVDTHLDSADIVLLLVSADFLASEYCWGKEVKRAMERHARDQARVIPVILRPVDWTGAPFRDLLALPTDARAVTTWPDRDAAFESIAVGIRKAVVELMERSEPTDGLISDANEPSRGIEGQQQSDIRPPLRHVPGAAFPQTEEEAAALIRTGQIANLRDAGGLIAQTITALQAGRLDDARATIEVALEPDTDIDPASLSMLADIASDADLFDLAARLFLRASELAPHVASYRRNMVVQLSRMGADGLALPFAQRLVAEDPTSQDLAEILAQVLSRAASNHEAWQFTSDAWDRFPRSVWLFQFALEAARQVGVPFDDLNKRALRFLAGEFATEQSEVSRGRAHSVYAAYLAREDHDKEAIEQFEMAFSLGEGSPISRGNYSVELAALGRDEDADVNFKKALASNPDPDDAAKIRRQYVSFLRSRGRRTEASEVAAGGSSDAAG